MLSAGERKTRSQKRNRIISNSIIYVVLAIISIIWIFPFVYLGYIKQIFR